MSQRRKTPTKYTESVTPRPGSRLRHVRLGIATEAARIIAVEGQDNYHAAKRKAAIRLGLSDRALPSNREVQEALQAYQDLFGGQQHSANLDHLRRTAADAMRLLHLFSPRLVGPVLDGTARLHSRISLHVFSETFEHLLLHLLENGIAFDQQERRVRWYDGGYRTIPLLVIELHGTRTELSIFSPVDLRQAPPSSIDGKPQQRASLAELEAMLTPAPVSHAGPARHRPVQ